MCKISDGELDGISRNEVESTHCLKLIQDSFVSGALVKDLSFTERALKRRIQNVASRKIDMDVKFLVPTPNKYVYVCICKRIFSIAGHAVSDRGQRILLSNF